MRWGTLLAAAGLLAPIGCLLARNVAHNLRNESAEQWDQRQLSKQFRAEARDAWATFTGASGSVFTAEFAEGFQDGYADFLESGGNGCPPAVPPPRYRRRDYLGPEGQALVRDYFAGFKAGTDAACASGRRPFLTVPVLLPDAPPAVPLPGTQVPAGTPGLRAGEQLPGAKPMEPVMEPPVRPKADTPPGRDKDPVVVPPLPPIPGNPKDKDPVVVPPLPPIPGKPKDQNPAPAPPEPKLPEVPPIPRSGAAPKVEPPPTFQPVSATEPKSPTDWPPMRRGVTPEVPLVGTRRLD